jgi:hypothetical protein
MRGERRCGDGLGGCRTARPGYRLDVASARGWRRWRSTGRNVKGDDQAASLASRCPPQVVGARANDLDPDAGMHHPPNAKQQVELHLGVLLVQRVRERDLGRSLPSVRSPGHSRRRRNSSRSSARSWLLSARGRKFPRGHAASWSWGSCGLSRSISAARSSRVKFQSKGSAISFQWCSKAFRVCVPRTRFGFYRLNRPRCSWGYGRREQHHVLRASAHVVLTRAREWQITSKLAGIARPRPQCVA